jgi:hypothetical protein
VPECAWRRIPEKTSGSGIPKISLEVLPILGRQKVFLRKGGLESRLVVPKHDRSGLVVDMDVSFADTHVSQSQNRVKDSA